jgi:predicted P-loop ATPase
MLKRRSLLELVSKNDAKPLVEPNATDVAKFETARGGLQHFQHSRSSNGIATSFENALIAIKLLKVDCRYDVFHDRVHVSNLDAIATSEGFDGFDDIALMLRQAVLLKYGFDPGREHMIDALRLECVDHSFDPVGDYLDGVKWDGVPRIDGWLTQYCGAADTPLNRAFARKVLVAAVRRVREPGYKFDFMLVLEGPQGQGKSTMLRVLAGDANFSDAEIIGDRKREQQEAIQGIWIYEIGELEGMSKHDVTAIKLFLSKTHDSARPAYGRTRVDRPRRCIFVGTTNDDSYLRDTTGNRRFWPVKLRAGLIDVDEIARDRDELWAEAAFAEAKGEAVTIPSELWSAASIEQQARVTRDAWEDLIERRLAGPREDKVKDGAYWIGINDSGGREWRVASSYLLGVNVLGISNERQTNAVTKRLADVMRASGWSKPSGPIRVGDIVCRGFTKAIDEPEAITEEPKAIAERAIVEAVSEAKPKLVLIRRPIRL